MNLQHVWQHEALPAVVADVGPLPVVRAAVDPDVPGGGEPLLADLARVALLVPVLGRLARHLRSVGVEHCLGSARTALVVGGEAGHHVGREAAVRVGGGELVGGQASAAGPGPPLSFRGEAGPAGATPLAPGPGTTQCPRSGRGWQARPWHAVAVVAEVGAGAARPPPALHHVGRAGRAGRAGVRVAPTVVVTRRSASAAIKVGPHLLLVWI